MICLGIANASFKPQDSDRVVNGYSLYLQYEPDEVGKNLIAGIRTDRVWVRADKLPDAFIVDPSDYIGKTVKVLYNRYGKVDEVIFSK